MEFKKIQLNGFKSFADKTNFLIEDGLTGIVGPTVVENQILSSPLDGLWAKHPQKVYVAQEWKM